MQVRIPERASLPCCDHQPTSDGKNTLFFNIRTYISFFHSSSLHRSIVLHRFIAFIASSFFIVEYALWIRAVEVAFCRRQTLSVTPHGSVGWHVAISTHTAAVTWRIAISTHTAAVGWHVAISTHTAAVAWRIPTPHRHSVECRGACHAALHGSSHAE